MNMSECDQQQQIPDPNDEDDELNRPTIDEDFSEDEGDLDAVNQHQGKENSNERKLTQSLQGPPRTPRDRLTAAQSLDAHIASHVLEDEAVLEDLQDAFVGDEELEKSKVSDSLLV